LFDTSGICLRYRQEWLERRTWAYLREAINRGKLFLLSVFAQWSYPTDDEMSPKKMKHSSSSDCHIVITEAMNSRQLFRFETADRYSGGMEITMHFLTDRIPLTQMGRHQTSRCKKANGKKSGSGSYHTESMVRNPCAKDLNL